MPVHAGQIDRLWEWVAMRQFTNCRFIAMLPESVGQRGDQVVGQAAVAWDIFQRMAQARHHFERPDHRQPGSKLEEALESRQPGRIVHFVK
jgi:hypothetical protein